MDLEVCVWLHFELRNKMTQDDICEENSYSYQCLRYYYFQWPDYLIFSIMLVAAAGVGGPAALVQPALAPVKGVLVVVIVPGDGF